MLIVAGWSWSDRIFAQQRVKRFPMQVREFIQERLGLSRGSQDAADRRQGEGAEVDGSLESGAHVVMLVMRHQRQQLLRL